MSTPGKQMDHAWYKRHVKQQTDEALRFTLKDAAEALEALPDTPNAPYYLDEINYCAEELARRAKETADA